MRCPKCGKDMWDDRQNKKNPRQPDFKCKDRDCDGVIWPAREKGGNGGGGRPARAPEPELSTEERSAGRMVLRDYYLKLMGFMGAEMKKIATKEGIPLEMKDVQAATFSLFSEMGRRRYLDTGSKPKAAPATPAEPARTASPRSFVPDDDDRDLPF